MYFLNKFKRLMPFILVASCQSETTSSTQVTNGRLDLGDQGVFMIVGEEPGSTSRSICTASLIRPNILLTAAHCVQNSLTGQFRSITLASAAGLRGVEIKIHPQYEYQGKPNFDVALIKLNGEVKNIKLMTFTVKLPKKGDQVRLVGFGGNQYTATKGIVKGTGVKRTGTTQIAYLSDHFIYSRGIRNAIPAGGTQPTGRDAALARGDSGGPLLDADGVIVGIAAQTLSTAKDQEKELPIISAHTSIAAIVDFIDESLRQLAP